MIRALLRNLGLLLLLAMLPYVAAAQTALRGVNVGPTLTAGDIATLAEWKVNLVRFNLVWTEEADSADLASYNQWLNSNLEILDALLPVFEAHHIKVLLNLHTPPGGFYTRKGLPQHRLFRETWAQDAFDDTWQTLVARYAANATIWGYDVLNEPAEGKPAAGLKTWKELVAEVAAQIRASDSIHTIVIEPPYGDQARFGAIDKVPVENVVYSFHMYFPLAFLQQGLYGRPIKFNYPAKGWNKRKLANNMKRALAFSEKNGVRIYVGEFSAIRWAPKNSAYRYLRDLIPLLEERGWDWTYHAFREADAWSVEHDTNKRHKDPVQTLTDRAQLLISYFAKNLF
ncbi:MAG: glycoside hydrolase family 5 protein [Oligoflexia bacterium]|nr:glycoside hydrolase family 5 protein [Oligoflexia bacterium]